MSPTKTNILKTLASFLDPLGHLQPIIIHYKLLFYKLSKIKLKWNTEIPSNLIKEWNDLLKILNNLDSAEINRKVFVNYDNDLIVKR